MKNKKKPTTQWSLFIFIHLFAITIWRSGPIKDLIMC